MFQIGGMPGRRSSEHLFVLKSIIALYVLLGLVIIVQFYDIRRFFDKESLRDGLNTVYEAGVDKKLYRLWYKLNKNTKIRIKTAVGMTDYEEVGEIIGQGSSGGAIVSAANLDNGVNKFFEGSSYEVSYGNIPLKPLMFQDDIARVCCSAKSAQAGNIKLCQMTNIKQLNMHPDKTIHMIMGQKNNVIKVRNEIKENPLIFDNFEMKEKDKEKWLGDKISQGGLSKSVQDTIFERSGKAKTASIEVKAIIEDFRMQCVGGLLGAFDIWEMAILQSLLNNSETWTEISNDSVKEFEDIQNSFIRMVLDSPRTTPKEALLWETGLISMEAQVFKRKLRFINHIKQSEGTLANIIYKEQVKNKWPGLSKEGNHICELIDIPLITQNNISTSEFDRAVKAFCEKKCNFFDILAINIYFSILRIIKPWQ